MIYVDPIGPCAPNDHWPYTESCHMIADSTSELLLFASKIGLKEEWLQQGPTKFPHFDLTRKKRELAVSLGAIQLDWRAFVEKQNKIKIEQWICEHTEELGKEVRKEWVRMQTKKGKEAKPEHLLPYAELDPWNKTIDDHIGVEVARFALRAYINRGPKE